MDPSDVKEDYVWQTVFANHGGLVYIGETMALETGYRALEPSHYAGLSPMHPVVEFTGENTLSAITNGL